MQIDKKVKKIRCDNASEFVKLAKHVKKNEIVIEFTTSYIFEQNDVAEQINQMLLTIIRVLIFNFRILKTF